MQFSYKHSVSLSSTIKAWFVGLSLASVFAGTATPVFAQQDFIFGGDARLFAMGGAGLALMQTRSSRPNPATLAFERRIPDPTFPTLGFRTSEGMNQDRAGGYLVAGAKPKDAASLARDFGSNDSVFGLSGATAFRYGSLEIGASVIARGTLEPNAALQDWVRNGNRIYESLSPDARGDVFTVGYYNLPSIAYGQMIPAPKQQSHQVGVGVRLKYMNAFYSHYVADQSALLGLTPANLAPEMNGQERLERTGLGMDFGVMIQPRKRSGFSAAFVVSNLVKPNFAFEGTDRNGNPFRVDPLATTYHAGLGYTSSFGTRVALDVADISGAAGQRQFRAGIEQRVWGPIYARGGYNSVTGATYGLGFFGLDVAFGNQIPLEVTQTLRF
ncbi:MAG: hypothetical protein OHK0029_12580 [Armatimonadaceae bacterium]